MTLNVSDMMTRKLELIEATASVQETAKKMKDTNVSSLLIVDNEGKPLGLVTERDLAGKVCINDVYTSKITNKEIMSSPIITIDSKSSASEAVDLMLRNNIRHLIVVDESHTNKPVGMITPLDLRDEEYSEEGLRLAIEELSEYYR
jgi:signal-transduction protein with cAMP-binding, CBS, and nucleotidyltransferase domain